MFRPFLALLVTLPVPLASAQETTVLLREGDPVDGRALGYAGGATVDEDGRWWARVQTDALSGNVAYLLRDGAPWLRSGQRISQPSAIVQYPSDPVGSDENRVVIVVLVDIQPPLSVSGNRAAVLRNERALLIQGELLGVAGLPVDARCGRIDTVAANTHDTVVVNLLVAGTPTLVRFRFAPDGTELVRERILGAGDDLGGGRIVNGFARVAVDEGGEWLVRATTNSGDSLLVGASGVVLASGDASPIAGRNIASVLRFADNDEFGRFAAAVRLEGDPATDQLLVVDGTALAQESDLIPSLSPLVPPAPLVEIGPLRRARGGPVYWLAGTTSGSFALGSFLRDDVPFLQTGVSTVGAETVAFFHPAANNFELSPDGRFWLGRVFLANGDAAYLRIDFGASEPRPGCLSNPGTLRHVGGLVLPGSTLALELDAPAPLGALVRLHLSASGPAAPFECGIATPFGEWLVDPAGRLGALALGSYGGSALSLSAAVPASLSLVDVAIFAQGSFLAPGSVQLTNGLRFEVGAP